MPDFSSAMLGHLVGDYLLQNDYLAANKKIHSGVCALHCLLWTTSVAIFGGLDNYQAWCFLFVTHFVQDRTNVISRWMELIGQRAFRDGPCRPWSIIVVDNTWHLLAVYVACLLWR